MRWITHAAIVFAVALGLRLVGSESARVRPFDDAYHLKRIAWTAEHFPRILELDPERGEAGAFCPWPPLYDLVCAGLVRAANVDGVVWWMPPLFFSLLCAAVTALMGRSYSPAAGSTAGLGLALSPYLLTISRPAAIDHHLVEPALVLAILSCTRSGRGVLLGIAIAAALLVQPALIIAAGLAFLVVEKRDGVIAFSGAAAVIAVYRITRLDGYPDNAWFLGWPQVGLLAGAAVACLSGGWGTGQAGVPVLQLRGYVRSTAGKWPPQIRLVPLTLGTLTALAFPGVIDALIGAFRFVGRDPWLDTIVEFQPMFRDPQRWGTDLANLGGGAVLAFFLFKRHRTVALFAVVYLMLALGSRRFLVPAIPLFVVAGSIVAAEARTHLRRALVIGLTLIPPLAHTVWTIREPEPSYEALFQLAEEIHALPAGRVLAPWSYGHAIDVFGRHPVILDNFGPAASQTTFVDGSRALLERDPKKLREYCQRRDVRFLALPDPARQIAATAVSIAVAIPDARATVWWRLQNGETIEGFVRRGPNTFEVT